MNKHPAVTAIMDLCATDAGVLAGRIAKLSRDPLSIEDGARRFVEAVELITAYGDARVAEARRAWMRS